MEEEADGRLGPLHPQQMRQDHELVVMDPDLVVGPELRHQLLGEELVHLDIGIKVLTFVVGEGGEIVEKRPENGVGKTVVVIVVQVFINENGEDAKVLAGGM